MGRRWQHVPAWAAAALLFGGCAHVPARAPSESPSARFRAYAEALREGRLADAWALTRPELRAAVGEQAFEKRWADPRARIRAADAVDAAVDRLAAAAPELARSRATTERIAAARKVLLAFVKAASTRRFSAVYPLLDAALRSRYTPARLARDFQRAPKAAERVRRAELAASGPAVVHGERVLFPLGPSDAVMLVEEADGFKLASLE